MTDLADGRTSDHIAPTPAEQSACDNLPLATPEEEALLMRHRDIDNPEAA